MPGDSLSAQDFVDSHRRAVGGDGLFGIAEIADEFGISTRTIRFYESKGLLSPRRINGARVLDRRDRARLILILRAKAIGSSLATIKQYLDLYGAHGEGRAGQLKFVIERTETAIKELEARRDNIDTTLAELRVINKVSRKNLMGLKPK
jgi:DNA-binding transcriptional MerR regulator